LAQVFAEAQISVLKRILSVSISPDYGDGKQDLEDRIHPCWFGSG